MKTELLTKMNTNKYPLIHKNFSHYLHFNEIWNVNEWGELTNYLNDCLTEKWTLLD